jgi:uncharacterized protein (TIGR02145 family)
MNKLVAILMVLAFYKANAQNYRLTFAATGASNSIDSIQVRNLTQGTALTLAGTDTLNLQGVLDVPNTFNSTNKSLRIYPNPMGQKCTIEFEAPETGQANIAIFNTSGKRCIHSDLFLEKGQHTFQLNNLNEGLNLLAISSPTYFFSEKLMSQYMGNETADICFSDGKPLTDKGARISTTAANSMGMQYNDGEWLLIKAFSETYSSVTTIVPSASILIPITFFDCTDGEGNDYPTVQIGSQVWMAENLKTTKYSNGSDLPFVPAWADWENLTSPGYCWYNNDVHYKDSIGSIYNWYTAANANLCPTGWHVPSITEWGILSTHLGGAQVAGGKMKEVGTSRWKFPNLGATNESGFTANPGNYRHWDGNFPGITNAGNQMIWWAAEDGGSAEWAYSVNLSNGSASFDNGTSFSKKTMGYFVRCLRN